MSPSNTGKVFGIGFNKTGTTTLGRAFAALGITPIAEPRSPQIDFRHLTQEIFTHGNYAPALYAALWFRAFQDRPWNVWNMYRILDAAFPHSKFILTYRHPETWWRSVERWLSVANQGDAARLHRYLQHLRASHLDKEQFVAAYQRHNQEIRTYFGDRTDLLVVNFEEGDGWTPLCDFLDVKVPDLPFPHANRQTY